MVARDNEAAGEAGKVEEEEEVRGVKYDEEKSENEDYLKTYFNKMEATATGEAKDVQPLVDAMSVHLKKVPES